MTATEAFRMARRLPIRGVDMVLPPRVLPVCAPDDVAETRVRGIVASTTRV
jgi:hypothetical protein